MIKISAFRSVPEMAQGYVRDLTVRWALAEVGLDYEVLLVDGEERRSDSYRRLQPFGQVPTYEEDGLLLFESGAIVLHIAEKSYHLLPKDEKARASVKSWMFAAMNTIDPVVKSFEEIEYFYPDEEWAKLRRPEIVKGVTTRLLQLAKALEGRDYLAKQFSAADILMVMSLRNLGPSELILGIPILASYMKRCEGRDCFKAAMAKHIEIYIV